MAWLRSFLLSHGKHILEQHVEELIGTPILWMCFGLLLLVLGALVWHLSANFWLKIIGAGLVGCLICCYGVSMENTVVKPSLLKLKATVTDSRSSREHGYCCSWIVDFRLRFVKWNLCKLLIITTRWSLFLWYIWWSSLFIYKQYSWKEEERLYTTYELLYSRPKVVIGAQPEEEGISSSILTVASSYIYFRLSNLKYIFKF